MPLARLDGPQEAFLAYRAREADAAGLRAGDALLREEDLGVGLSAEGFGDERRRLDLKQRLICLS